MAVFEYKAVTASGETLHGEMEAVSSDEVIARLQEAGNLPLLAKEAGSGLGFNLRSLGLDRKRVGSNDIGVITQQLATLLDAGLPLDRALTVQADLAENERIKKMMVGIRDEVRGGSPLSDSLEAQHGTFSRLYTNMVRAGEMGGSLDRTLEQLAEYMQRSKDLKDGIISALIYPIILLVLAITSLMILLTYVVPQFAPIFEELGGEMPFMTRVVLGVGGALQNYWWLMVGIVVAIVMWFRHQMMVPDTRRKWDHRFLKMRMVGDLVKKVNTARLARTVGTLLINGVPVLASLSIGRSVMSNTVLAEDVDEAAESVKKGDSLARSLSETGRFPRLALQMISVGEETGKLDVMLLKVANTYDDEVKTAVDRMMALLVPVLTLGLAVMIATIVISILMAILSVNDLVG